MAIATGRLDTGRYEAWQKLEREARHHVFEIIAIDQDGFAPHKPGIEHSAVFTTAEIAQNCNPEWRFGIGALDSLAALTSFDFDLGKRSGPWHDTATLSQVQAEIEPERAVASDFGQKIQVLLS